jgi:DNA replication and repair protein RecF
MALRRVHVADFRCVQAAELQLDPGFTLITGRNASGKTSLLEAIYVLSRGRSFRTRKLDHLIRASCARFVVFGEAKVAESSVGVGVEGSGDGVRARLGGDRVSSMAELAAVLPVQIIDPEVHRLIEDGPSRRRRFLDWGVFHVEQSFIGYWQKYQQALRQRNAALRGRMPRNAIVAWDGELTRLGDLIDQARRRYVDRLTGPAVHLTRALLGLELGLSYRAGWARDLTFQDALGASYTHDLELGSTSVGPQRAELAIRLGGVSVRDRISRGQQKLVAAALLMAQVELFPSDTLSKPTLLLDDPAAELDSDRLMALINEVTRSTAQLIVTSLSAEFSAFGAPGRHFSVDGGVVSDA